MADGAGAPCPDAGGTEAGPDRAEPSTAFEAATPGAAPVPTPARSCTSAGVNASGSVEPAAGARSRAVAKGPGPS